MTIIPNAEITSSENCLLWNILSTLSHRQWNNHFDSVDTILKLFENFACYSCRYTLLQHRFLLWSSKIEPAYQSRVEAIVRKIFHKNYHRLITEVEDASADSAEFNSLERDVKIALIHIASTLGRTNYLKKHKETISPLLSEKSFFGGTPFLAANSGNHHNTIRLLLELNPDLIHEKNRLGFHPIHKAAIRNDFATIDLFLDISPKLSSECYTEEGLCLIHIAVQTDNLSLLKHLRERDDEMVYVPTKDGRQVIHLAALWQKTTIINYLLEKTPELIYEKDLLGQQIFHYAALVDDVELVKKLIQIDPSLMSEKDSSGHTPLHIAAIHNNSLVFNYLAVTHPKQLESYTHRGEFCSHLAAHRGHTLLLKQIKESAFPDCNTIPSANGWLPIHLAAKNGEITTFIELAAANPETVETITSEGYSSLYIALLYEQQQILEYLINCRPELLLKKGYSELTPFDFSLRHSRFPMQFIVFKHTILQLWKNDLEAELGDKHTEEELQDIVTFINLIYLELTSTLNNPPFNFKKISLSLAFLRFFFTIKAYLYGKLKEKKTIFGTKSKIKTRAYKNLIIVDVDFLISSLTYRINEKLQEKNVEKYLAEITRGLDLISSDEIVKSLKKSSQHEINKLISQRQSTSTQN